MTAEELRSDLEKRGARLRLVDDRLRCEAPGGTLTDTDRALLTEHKPALLALLRTEHERQTRLADHLLTTQGWVVVRCRNLDGAEVLWTVDGDRRVPPDVAHLPRYTMAELEHITPANLWPVYNVKRVFQAEVVDPEGV